RKVSILVAVLLLVGTFAFAQSLDFEWGAEASATWGVQLDEIATGFQNDAEFTAAATLKEEATEEFGEGDVYGWIEVEDVVVEIDEEIASDGEEGVVDVGIGDITGRIIFGNAYLEVYDTNVAEVDLASDFSKIAQDIVAFEGALAGTTWATAGAAVGFEVPDLVSVELGIGSATPWDDEDEDKSLKNEYGFSIDADITPADMITVDVVSNMHFGDTEVDDAGAVGTEGNPAAVGVGLGYEMPMDGMVLAPEAGVDLVFEEDAAEDLLMDVQVGAGVNLTWADLGTDEDAQTIFGVEDEVTSGVGLGFTYLMDAQNKDVTHNSYGVKLGVYEDEGDDGLLPIVGGAAIVNYNVLLEETDASAPQGPQSDLGFGVELNADLGVVAPYFGYYMGMLDLNDDNANPDLDDDGEDADDFMYLQVGTDINVIANTTFTIEYNSGDLGTETDPATWGDVYSDGPRDLSSAKAGELSLKTTISF
ncbi:MAG: hypothetical protein ACLFPP_09220, partial [Spirochaetaceae bacterium]